MVVVGGFVFGCDVKYGLDFYCFVWFVIGGCGDFD